MIIWAVGSATFWGSIVLLTKIIGGSANEQTLGITLGNFLLSVVLSFILPSPYHSSPEILIIAIISGIFWSFGQLYQLKLVQNIDISRTLPITTATNLVINCIIGTLVYKEWNKTTDFYLGIFGLLVIIFGILAISATENNYYSNKIKFKYFFHFLLTTAGFVGYVNILKFFSIGGMEAILPQAIGMLVSSLFLNTLNKNSQIKGINIFKNILTGVVWGLGNLFLLISLSKNGIILSYVISQTGIIISTLGGIIIFKEVVTTRKKVLVLLGALLIVIGSILITLSRI